MKILADFQICISVALIDPKPLLIRFFKIDGFIRIYNGTRYLTLLGSEKYKVILKQN